MRLYLRLAADGIRKNRRLYLPYLLTCAGMIAVEYILCFLAQSNAISFLPGGETVAAVLAMGGGVVAIFSGIFLFYTDAFLLRRRKTEFGLYIVLGMGRRNIARVLFWETALLALSALFIGLFSGFALSKLAELGLVRMIRGEVTDTFSASPGAFLTTAAEFGVIFLLLYLNALRQIRRADPAALLQNAGEKPPKGNLLLGLLGILALAAAYYLAAAIEDPVAALAVFFLAVVLVIFGTYLTMISGSVLLLRALQRRKRYYYRPNHFVSVSSMVYRMKRNGAGLASVCILATMVLVMLASSASLFVSEEATLLSRYPREIDLDFRMQDVEALSDETLAALQGRLDSVLEVGGITPENAYAYRCVALGGQLQGTEVETDVTKVTPLATLQDVYQFFFLPLDDYNAIMGTRETLAEGEALLCLSRGGYSGDTISFRQGSSFRIKKQAEFLDGGTAEMTVVPSMLIVVPDLAQAVRGMQTLADYNGDRMISPIWRFNFDTGAEPERQIALYRAVSAAFADPAVREDCGVDEVQFESRALNRETYYGMFGGIFYLGIILSAVFLAAAVLILYYKQLSEGYEDRPRFAIMRKVGMTGREIRRSVNAQLFTVFFLPLILAAVHLAFAFPILRKILLMFGFSRTGLFAAVTVGCVAVFSLFYLLVYRLTSNAYYRIVSGAKSYTDI